MDWGDDFRFRDLDADRSDSDEDEGGGKDVREEDMEDAEGEKKKRKNRGEILPEVDPELELPKTADDYEKLLLSSPQQSYVWIQYMAFWLGSTMLDKAREIAKRAIQRIDPSKVKQKLDIWVAYLNMENTFGTRESFMEVFKLALDYNDKKQIYTQAIRIFRLAKDDQMVRELFKSLTSKFKTNKSVWIKFAIYLYRTDKPAEARDVLKRSLKCLPQRKHILTISKFAQLEYQFGQVEVARTMFEDLLSTYPKRIDIYIMYIDQETRLGDADKIRVLYERVTSLRLSVKKMKFLFQKFLKFEEDHGTEERVEYVKRKASEYVEWKENKTTNIEKPKVLTKKTKE